MLHVLHLVSAHRWRALIALVFAALPLAAPAQPANPIKVGISLRSPAASPPTASSS